MLRTLFEKYGLQRQEIFINSKQGLLTNSSTENLSSEFIFKELLAAGLGIKEEDFTEMKIDN